jgi:hypothetical protein
MTADDSQPDATPQATSMRLSPRLLADVDAWAATWSERNGGAQLSRTAAVAMLLSEALRAAGLDHDES